MRAGYLVEALSLPAPARSPGTSVEVLPSVRAAVCWPELLCLPWRVSAVRHRPLAAARGRRTVHGRTMPGANALECSMLTRSSLPLAVCSLFGRRSFFSLPRRQLTVKALWSSLAALACAVNMAAAREDWLPSRQRHSPASLENHVDARAVAGAPRTVSARMLMQPAAVHSTSWAASTRPWRDRCAQSRRARHYVVLDRRVCAAFVMHRERTLPALAPPMLAHTPQAGPIAWLARRVSIHYGLAAGPYESPACNRAVQLLFFSYYCSSVITRPARGARLASRSTPVSRLIRLVSRRSLAGVRWRARRAVA